MTTHDNVRAQVSEGYIRRWGGLVR